MNYGCETFGFATKEFLFVLFFVWHLTALNTEFGKDDVKTPWRHRFIKLKICLPLLLKDLYCNRSSRQ